MAVVGDSGGDGVCVRVCDSGDRQVVEERVGVRYRREDTVHHWRMGSTAGHRCRRVGHSVRRSVDGFNDCLSGAVRHGVTDRRTGRSDLFDTDPDTD